MKKKVNPRRRPATEADVLAAEKRGTDTGVTYALALFLSVMRDKEGYGVKRLQRVWSEVNNLADSTAKGYLDVNDMLKTLKAEAGIEVKL